MDLIVNLTLVAWLWTKIVPPKKRQAPSVPPPEEGR